ncbi:MAG: NRDE family protein [Pseudomonadota bacterium]
MCILFIAIEQHKDYPLIIAANRDEFHQRPTLASHVWESASHILAGKDELANGTWMGINKFGHIAAITNIRAPGREVENAISRGGLVTDFLDHQPLPQNYHQQIKSSRQRYNGYNLLFGQLTELSVYNNFEDDLQRLTPGVYGLSNAMLNTPWPKLDAGKAELAKYCQQDRPIDFDQLFSLLKNKQPAQDELLPKTGVPIEWEKKLSSIFIQSPEYGTRSSTLLLINNQQHVYWQERTFNATSDEINRVEHTFAIQDTQAEVI